MIQLLDKLGLFCCIRSINRGKSLNDERQTSQNRSKSSSLPRVIERIRFVDNKFKANKDYQITLSLH